MIANARMYSVAPGAADAWRTLLAWVLRHAALDWDVIEHAAPTPIAELWARKDLGCAFMCGLPYARASLDYQLLAAPIPAPARYNGRPIYFTDLVVKADSKYQTLEDTFGSRLAFTVEDSQSGYHAVRQHLLGYRLPSQPALYASLTRPLVSPRRVLQAVADGAADIGPLDGYAHDLMKMHDPEFAAQVRVIATTASTPIPPLVAAGGADHASILRLRAALLEVADAPELRATRDALLLKGFAAIEPDSYAILESRARAAEAGAYAGLL